MFGMSREEVTRIKNEYPVGTRVECRFCADVWSPISTGTKGTVRCVDDIGTVHVNWDNGRSLGMVLGEDSIAKI